MKKPRIPPIAVLTIVFVAFLLGFFAGRNLNRTPVRVQTLPGTAIASTEASTPSQMPAISSPERININTATVEQLQTLPGIGPVLAQRIVDYRTENGNFSTVGALSNVDGIGETRLETIWDFVTTGG